MRIKSSLEGCLNGAKEFGRSISNHSKEYAIKTILLGAAGLALLEGCCANYSGRLMDNPRYMNPMYMRTLANTESRPSQEKKDGSGWKFIPLLPINVGAKIIRGERISALDFIHDLAIVGGGYSIYRNNNKKEDKKSSGGGSNPPYPPDSGGGDDGDKDDGW